MKTEDAERYKRVLTWAIVYLEEDKKVDPEVIEELRELRDDLVRMRLQGNPVWRNAHEKKIRDERVQRGHTQTVGEVLAQKAEQGEKAVLDALKVSRASFYRRLKKLRDYAEEEGLDVNSVMYWSDDVR